MIGAVVVVALAVVVVGVYYARSAAVKRLPAALAVSPGAAAGFNVVLFTLDTLRADRVGCYGYKGVQTPVLDALAARGTRFADAVTPVPITLPSHGTILTGNYPPRIDVRDNGLYRLLDHHQTLAERLRREGYTTAAFIAAFVLERRYGLTQGFDLYDDDFLLRTGGPGSAAGIAQRPGNDVVDSAIKWLDSSRQGQPDKPFFAWIHLFDPHTPYTPPEPFRTRYAANLYDGEVAFTDVQVGRFLDRLKALKLLDKTLIVAVGDHGEGLGDHGESTHSLLIYGTTMRVPLIFSGPALIPGGHVVDDRVVATVDLLPTILDLLGLEVPDCDGMSLLRRLQDSDRAVYMETLAPELNHGWSPLYGLRRHHDKYIEAPTPEYYDLLSDPGELSNLLAGTPDAGGQLRERLAALMNSFPTGLEGGDATVTLDDEARRKLQALGYVGGAETVPDGPPRDPKDMVAMWERQIIRANKLVASGRSEEAIRHLKGLFEITRHDAGVWALLSKAQTQALRFEESLQSRMRAIELQPDQPDHWIYLARLHYVTGDMKAARQALAEAERLDPAHGEIYLVRAEFARAGRQYEEALALCEEGRRRDPIRQTGNTWAFQGKVYNEMGRLAEAAAAYENAYAADPMNPAALLGLAVCAERDGRYQRTVELCSRVSPGHAEWLESRMILARAYLSLDRGDQAVNAMRELRAAAPNEAEVHRVLGDVLHRTGRLAEAEESYRRAIELNPRDARSHYSLGLALRDQGNLDASITPLKTAVQIDPSLHTAWLALARIHAERGEVEQGLACLEPLLRAGTLTREQARADPTLEPLTQDPQFEELGRPSEAP